MQNNFNNDKIKIKVILVGNTMVGKTTILSRMRTGIFNPDSIATIGASFITLNHKNILFDVWDTAGQERFAALTPMYFRDVKIILFVFDVSDVRSIRHINRYKDTLDSESNYTIMVIGNKMDLLEGENSLEVLTPEITKNFQDLMLSDKIRGIYFISAKTGDNFQNFLNSFYEYAELIPMIPNKKKENTIKFETDKLIQDDIADDRCCS